MPSSVQGQNYGLVANLFKNYPNFTLDDAFNISQEFLSELKEGKYSALDLILMIEEYLTTLIKNNLNNPNFIQSAMSDLKKAQTAERMLSATVQAKTVFNWLLIEFVKNF